MTGDATGGGRLAVYVEAASKRTFAVALDWPGWARSGRTEPDALEALVAYGPRYAAVVGPVDPSFRVPPDVQSLEIVERLEGDSGTDFGIPGRAVPADERPLDDAELDRQRRLLEASWEAFERAVRSSTGLELRRGPRGGGRQLDKMVGHVVEAEAAYVRQLGARPPRPGTDRLADFAALHAVALDALAARARGEEPTTASGVRRRWSPRYYVRRSAWHALDHAWEIEDRVLRPGG